MSRSKPLTLMSSPVAGIDTSNGGERSGDDTRKRGWFWHWNAIVTQFAPLVGLKGVGLLNSYTVWTDRREESPHRGYAFPSQQSEADFYGEDRAELIAINKILVTLDLIEIRKEMVLRTDEAGRRWRVPHNFYRVKDRDEGFSLTPEAVRKIVCWLKKTGLSIGMFGTFFHRNSARSIRTTSGTRSSRNSGHCRLAEAGGQNRSR